MKINNANIVVLLSTYNGESYLEAQLDSLLSQDCEFDLLIRDDGSTDRTLEIVDRYVSTHNFIKVIRGKNIGAKNSFSELVSESVNKYEFYFFCDQDDIWYSNKISSGVSFLYKKNCDLSGPVLYMTGVDLCDAEGNVFGGYSPKNKNTIDLILNNNAIGCTVCFNNSAALLYKKYASMEFYMHDWWINILVSLFGTVFIDERHSLAYRQHGKNVVGVGGSVKRRISSAMKIAFDKKFIKNRVNNFLQIKNIVSNENNTLQYNGICPKIKKSKIDSFLDRVNLIGFSAGSFRGFGDILVYLGFIFSGKK